MPRRGENIYHRKDGLWQARYVKGLDEFGKKKYGYVYAHSYKEVKEKRLDVLSNIALISQTASKRSIILTDLVREWLYINQNRIKPSTYQKYSNFLKNHIIDQIGKYPVIYLTPVAIKQYTDKKLEEGLSPTTIYDMENYKSYINNIEKYANLKASDGIPGFQNKAGKRFKTISYSFNSFAEAKELSSFLEQPSQFVKVDIDVHNVYGWANFYYDNARLYKQKPEKKEFFKELRKPVATLCSYINPWTGHETDFKYIMDILNDPATQKDLGAFYTPPTYVKKAIELVKKAIEKVPKGNDYVIIDRCAGTGNLEMYFDEEILSHVIISTYELKEWIVLKDRFGKQVRYIIPPIPENPKEFPELNTSGFLCGANALTYDIVNNTEIQKYYNNDKCTIILFENPPFVEGKEVVKKGDKTIVQKKKSVWKTFELSQKMSAEINGVALNEMGNVFIWSAFKYFLRQPTDSYIVFSPIKYWKAQQLIKKKFCGGFAFNRKHFHSDSSCVSCIYWSNEEDNTTTQITLKAYDIDNNELKPEEDIIVKQVWTKL